MKVTLDLSRLLRDGAITQAEHDKLARFALQDTGLLLINILIGFGVFAVSAGAIALLPSTFTGIVLGGALMAVGIGLILSGRQWAVLANICILVAALTLGAGIILLSQGMTDLWAGIAGKPMMNITLAYFVVFLLFVGTAALARSSLLATLAVLMLFAILGSSAGYEGDAFYDLEVNQPLAVTVLFSALALAAYQLSHRWHGDWERLAIAVSRTAVFLVNLGFWVGSLWGDDLTWARVPEGTQVSAGAFATVWAVALLVTAIWAARANRRWVLNLAAVFGGIHFYTQWFETLGATPLSMLGGGILVLIFALVLWQLNQHMVPPRSAAGAV